MTETGLGAHAAVRAETLNRPAGGPGGPAGHPDFEKEQGYVDFAYSCLDRMREAARRLHDSVIDRPAGGTHQDRYQRDVFAQHSLERLDYLDIGDAPLVFGGIQRESGEAFHIGRRAVYGHDQEPVVIDWRVPAAEAFYRATGRNPLGLELRRHLLCRGPRIVSIEDERFSDDPAAGELGMAGPGALLSAVEARRTGRMRDIVATVQREQDEIIRSPLEGVLAVQGGPGTGKTAVALHRAAYLLFTHRRELERKGVLVVGPNRLYLRYIREVLPALGESGAVLSTPGGLVGWARATASDAPEAARVKGSERMVKVISHAVACFEKKLGRDARIGAGGVALLLTARASAEAVSAAARARGTHNQKRALVEKNLVRRLYTRYRRAAGENAARRLLDRDEFAAELSEEEAFAEALDSIWPLLTPQRLIGELLGSAELLEKASGDLLDSSERALLLRRDASEEVRWSAADLPLLEEALAQLGPGAGEFPGPNENEEDEEAEEPWRVYGHVIVDEVQDLSPMQLRMLARRSTGGSMTVVGDLAQATGGFAPAKWEEILCYLVSKGGATKAELTINYRTPAEIMEAASSLLDGDGVGFSAPQSIRRTGSAPVFWTTGAGEVASEAANLAAADPIHEEGGTLAVIAPSSAIPAIAEALAASGAEFSGEAGGLDKAVSLLTPEMSKGLEFDSVIVVEPVAMVRESISGKRALYVSMTRATQRLTLVGSEPFDLGSRGLIPKAHA
jgi:DNA helicase IV